MLFFTARHFVAGFASISGRFTPPPPGKYPRYPLNRMLYGPQSRFRLCGVEKDLLLPP
jgi:hypothetical protein